MTTGWKLTPESRNALLAVHPPRYPRVIADHVTLTVSSSCPLPPPQSDVRIVGRSDDGKGVEAMVVAIDGSTRRPDGMVWHITWSLGETRTARESNAIIADLGWTPLEPAEVETCPAQW